MPVERQSDGPSYLEVFDRVLDKGIVIDAWMRVSVVGIDLFTVEARVVVASISTYLTYADDIRQPGGPATLLPGTVTGRSLPGGSLPTRPAAGRTRASSPRRPPTAARRLPIPHAERSAA